MRVLGANTIATVSVGSSSTQLLAADADRLHAVITNISDETVYLSEGAAAEASKGYPLAPLGDPATEASRWRTGEGDVVFRGAVYGICASGSKNVAVQYR